MEIFNLNFDFIKIGIMLSIIINLLFGVLLYIRSKKEVTDTAFFFVLTGVVFWGISKYVFVGSHNPEIVLIAAKFLYLSAAVMPFAFLSFSYTFPNLVSGYSFLRKVLHTIPFLIILLISAYPNALIHSVEVIENGKTIINFNNNFNILYILYMFIYFGLSYYNLIKKILTYSGLHRMQVLYVTVGTSVSVAIGSITSLFMPLAGSFDLFWLGPIATLFMTGVITVAIIKHNLFNMKVFVVEFLTSFIGLIILIRFVFVTNYTEYTINGIVLIGVIVFGYTVTRGVVNDIKVRTKIENLIAQLTVANNRLEQLDKQKTEFVSIASHQLRTPLTAIKGYASMLVEGSFGKIQKKAQEPIEKIYRSSQKLVMIVENFLTISRLDQNRMVYRFKKVNLTKVVKVVIKELHLTIEQKGITITKKLSRGMLYVRGDEIKVKQIIYNLLSNSIKHAGTDKIFIEAKSAKSGKIILRIISQKRRLEKDEIKRLFDRKDVDYNRKVQDDTGIELFLSKEIVNAHRGYLKAEVDGKNNFIFTMSLLQAKSMKKSNSKK